MQRRSAEEVEQLLRGYEASGLSRAEYCRRLGIPVTTFDYYRQRGARKAAAKKRAEAKLVRVKVVPAPEARDVFTIILHNGRRIATNSKFDEEELIRLIRIVEAA
jgi:DNA-binding CsgD family transcriptional regulator